MTLFEDQTFENYWKICGAWNSVGKGLCSYQTIAFVDKALEEDLAETL